MTAIVLLIIGALFLLSIFGLAGRFGQTTLRFLTDWFGLSGFVVPFIFIAGGAYFWSSQKARLRVPSIIGIVILLLFAPGLFVNHGGAVGIAVSRQILDIFGKFGGYLIILGVSLIGAILASNIGIKQIKDWLFLQESTEQASQPAERTRVSVFETVRRGLKITPKQSSPQETKESEKVKKVNNGWQAPPTDLLDTSSTKAIAGNINKNVEVIQNTLKQFGINVTMAEVHVGPTVTQYTLKPSQGVKVGQIVARSNDLALALAAHPIRIEAPIPGKAAVGIEIPNKAKATVTLREIIESEKFTKASSELSLGLGRDVSGAPIIVDLKTMPHLLIAGSTGSGKSVAINALIMALLYQNSPADLKVILIDPKRVEFTLYNNIPHLLTPVVTEVDKTVNTLRWVVHEMERRFEVLSKSGKRNIEEYNKKPSEEEGVMPYLAVIIDELADLMAQSANEVEATIVRLAQLARATGIHLIVATQRPSVDVITGLIKANITTRIAFAVASQVDSRTIIDQAGAEKLLGNGDMLYMSSEFGKPKRIQGSYLSEKEIKAVSEFLKKGGSAQYNEEIQSYHPAGTGGRGVNGENLDDEMYNEAKQIVLQTGKASASLLQRRLRVGYARAARLLDMLESQGIIGHQDGSKPRDVLAGIESTSLSPEHQQEDRGHRQEDQKREY